MIPSIGEKQHAKALAIGFAAISITAAAAHATCPEVGQAAKEFTIKEGFLSDPRVHNVTAGDSLDLGKCTSLRGKGWITKRPDFVVNYKTKSGPSAFTLTFRIESSADTVLLINGPDGRWHFDDDGGKGLNARMRFQKAPPGRYDIWVGTYSSKPSKAKLVISELE
jgi:hypothetical protein